MTQPDIIRSIYDNDGASFDRFTVVLNELGSPGYWACFSLSLDPEHALGFSQFGDCEDGDHLGYEIQWADLPENVQEHIWERLDQ